MAGVPVEPGDYVLADASGVVIVPAQHAAQIVTLADDLAAERQMAAATDAGMPISQVMDDRYERMTLVESASDE